MTFKELKEAFMNDSPVKFRGAEYKKITCLSFKKDREGHVIETATLIDPCGRSEVTVLGKEVEQCD
jgi:hypothetical protein